MNKKIHKNITMHKIKSSKLSQPLPEKARTIVGVIILAMFAIPIIVTIVNGAKNGRIEREREDVAWEQQKTEREIKKQEEESRRKNEITTDDYVEVTDMAKYAVKQNLKAPSTAKFQGGVFNPVDGWNVEKIGKMTKFSSVVDSQNSFGAMVRSSFSITVCKVDDKIKVAQFVLDGRVAEGQNFEQCN